MLIVSSRSFVPHRVGMAVEESPETTDVVIIGAGPTGLTLSTTLATQRVRNIVLEKDTEIWPYPRAFRNSESSFRALQAVGLGRKMYDDITRSTNSLWMRDRSMT